MTPRPKIPLKETPKDAKKPKDEWPDYLDKTILNVITEKLNFKKMTPVQVTSDK